MMFEALEQSQESRPPDHSESTQGAAHTSIKVNEIVITDGWYRDGAEGRRFEVKIYLDKDSGRYFTLVPLYVQNPPEKWVKVG